MRPAAYPETKSSTTAARNSSSRSMVRCGIPSEWASARAPITACGEQQLFSPSVRRSAQSFSVTPTTSLPASRSRSAATALSTPPDIATSTRFALGSASAPSPPAIAAVSARWSASAARSAAWRPCGESPPRASAISPGPTSAASRTASPSTSSATAAPAARAVAHPSASKRAIANQRSGDDQGDADQVPARSAPGGAGDGTGRRVVAPARVAQEMLERASIHARSVAAARVTNELRSFARCWGAGGCPEARGRPQG